MITESFILFRESFRDLYQRLIGVMTSTIDLLRMPVAIVVYMMPTKILN